MNNKELFDWAKMDGWKEYNMDGATYLQSPNNYIILDQEHVYLGNDIALDEDGHRDYIHPYNKSFEVDALNKLLVCDNIMAIKYDN